VAISTRVRWQPSVARLGVRGWVVALLGFALALRVAFVFATADTPLVLDPLDFDNHAVSIAQGHGYPSSGRAPAGGPSAFRPPGFPYVVAGIYAVIGHDPLAAQVVLALLGTLAAGLTALIAAMLWGRRVGLIALGIAALAPPIVVLSTAFVSEALFVPVVLGAVAATLQTRRSPRPLLWTVLVGALAGLAILTRTNGLLLLVPLCLAAWRAPWTRLRSLAPPAAVLATAVLVVAPWTLRNAAVLHAFVPVSTQAGYTLAGTYNEASRADGRSPALWREAEHGDSPEYADLVDRAARERWGEVKLGRRMQSQALAEIRHDPAYVLKAGLWNTLRTFHLTGQRVAYTNLANTAIPHWAAALEIYGFYPLGLLALLGLLAPAARRAPAFLWLVPLLLASTVFVTSFIRFRSPLDPFLVMLAALALAWLSEARRGAQSVGLATR
jgi:4-amino-4-deoxy-L-arabinose transferase-like glycosyltransferase